MVQICGAQDYEFWQLYNAIMLYVHYFVYMQHSSSALCPASSQSSVKKQLMKLDFCSRH